MNHTLQSVVHPRGVGQAHSPLSVRECPLSASVVSRNPPQVWVAQCRESFARAHAIEHCPSVWRCSPLQQRPPVARRARRLAGGPRPGRDHPKARHARRAHFPRPRMSARAAVPALWHAFCAVAATPSAAGRSSLPARSIWLWRARSRAAPLLLGARSRVWVALSGPGIAPPEPIWGAFRPPAPLGFPSPCGLDVAVSPVQKRGNASTVRGPLAQLCDGDPGRDSGWGERGRSAKADGETHHPRGLGGGHLGQPPGGRSAWRERRGNPDPDRSRHRSRNRSRHHRWARSEGTWHTRLVPCLPLACTITELPT